MSEREGDRVILITGASRGIGHAIASYLVRASPPNRVILVARTSTPLQDLQTRYPTQVRYVTGDVASPGLAGQAIQLGVDAWGRLDGVVLNHGTMTPVARIGHSSAEEWAAGFRVNFLSCVEFVKEALPHLRQSKQGRIVLTSSGAAAHAYAGWGAYGAAKAALNHLALTVAVEEPDVVVVAVRPGVVDTEMQVEIREVYAGTMDERDRERFARLKREGELLRPEQPGNVMARLVLGAGRELSGRFVSWNDAALEKFQDR
ncbi:MAG: hypothetical protein M1816_000435 [Peltula sp. TS41687]|nr:MAG: hypothetical protein M1816_000435 [Peltula sp. TS41687]